MAIPTYQDLLLPALQLLEDQVPRQVADIVDAAGDKFSLTVDERKKMLPSGQDLLFRNRVRWALFYLKKAKLVETVDRGIYHITNRGRELLSENPQDIVVKDLMRYAEFKEFIKPKEEEIETDDSKESETTPEEELERIFFRLQSSLSKEVLDTVKSVTPQQFEQLVVDLLLKMGYGGSRRDAGEAVGRTGDGGIDGIIKEDKLGLDLIYVQAKRWQNTVGRPDVQAFAGSLEGVRAKRGIMMTTSQFSGDALEYVNNIEKRIILIDGIRLAELMIEHDLGVSVVSSFTVKRIDSDYFYDQ